VAFDERQARLKALEALEERAKQFRGREEMWPFRAPREPLEIDVADLDPRPVLRMEWADTLWQLWSVALPSGILIYGDSDGRESRVLASVKRGSPSEADGFFLERLAESRGRYFGIEMAGPPPERVRSYSIGDREFLADVFVELFEGTAAQQALSTSFAPDLSAEARSAKADFRTDVVNWLGRILTAQPARGRQPRVADVQP
jgi:hypothetical protein